MASMYRRNGVWYAKWSERGRIKRESLKTKSAQRARVKLVEIERALEAGLPVGYRKDCPVDEFTKILLPQHVNATKRPHTAKTLLHEWKHFCAWAKPIRLGDVTTETMARYKSHLLETKEKSTVRSSLLALSSIFAAAIKDMHVLEGVNPVKDVGLPKPDTRFPRYLEQSEIDKLLEAAKAHSRDLYMLVALGIFTGMRKNELINARWGWICLLYTSIRADDAGNAQSARGRACGENGGQDVVSNGSLYFPGSLNRGGRTGSVDVGGTVQQIEHNDCGCESSRRGSDEESNHTCRSRSGANCRGLQDLYASSGTNTFRQRECGEHPV